MKRIVEKARLASLMLLLVAAGGFSLAMPQGQPTAARSLSELQQDAATLQAEIAANESQAGQLASQARTLENTLAGLNNQIAQATAQIELTDIKIAQLEEELNRAQAELDRQKGLLKANMRALYKRGGASTVELLVASDSFSEFIDEQEYLERLKGSIQDSTQKVLVLKQDIEAKKNEQVELKKQQEAQRELVRQARQEQAVLLAETQGQEARFRARTAQLQQEQGKILAEIVSRSRVITGVGTGAYPWAGYREGSWTHSGSCTYGDDIDPWKYCYRQCTSFAAWRLYSAGKNPPVQYGNATNWGARARANGIPTGSQPRVGAIAVWTGFEGHVAYVEEVRSDGEVRISEYNAVPPLQGRYSQRIIEASDPSTYIYF